MQWKPLTTVPSGSRLQTMAIWLQSREFRLRRCGGCSGMDNVPGIHGFLWHG